MPSDLLLPARWVLVADADAATRALLADWLGEVGLAVVGFDSAGDAAPAQAAPPVLLVVDLPRPRDGLPESVRRLRAAWPAAPVLAVSPGFLPHLPVTGATAQRLGVQAVLPKPLERERVLGAVAVLLPGLLR